MKIRSIIIFFLVACLSLPLAAHAADDPTVERKEAVTVAQDNADSAAAPADKKAADETVKEPAAPSMGEEETSAPEAEGPEEAVEEKPIADPLEPVNRAFFTFNDRFYFWVMKPASKVYSAVVPEWGRVRVRNVFHNLAMPIRFVSSLLQLKVRTAAFELGSFMINSTWGLGGMFDIVKKPYDIHDQDLGLAFGHYGVGEGFYIVWPLIGPSCLRDSVGLAGDSFLYPVNYVTPIQDLIAIRAYEQLNNTSLRIGEYEDLKASALDPYISVRDAYKEHRRSRIKE